MKCINVKVMEEYFLTGIYSISETNTKNFENTSFAHTNYIWVIKLHLNLLLSLNLQVIEKQSDVKGVSILKTNTKTLKNINFAHKKSTWVNKCHL